MMIVLDNKRRKSSFLWIKKAEHFREDKVVLVGRGLVLFLSTFKNLWLTYNIITEQLSNDTHLFEFDSIDDLNNVSDAVQTSVAISQYVLPPRFPKITYVDRHHITLTWSAPSDGAPDNYVVYSNNGSGTIDTGSHYSLHAGTVLSVAYNLPANGTWKFRVEAVKDGLESNTEYEVHVVIPRNLIVPPAVFVDDEVPAAEADRSTAEKATQISAENISVGKMKIIFLWIYGDVANRFRIYHDNGGGTVVYANPIEFTRQNGYIQTYTTNQLYFGKANQTFKFVLRAVTADGVEEANTVEHEVELDGSAPEEISSLTVGSTF